MTLEEFKRDILRLQPRLHRTAELTVGDPDSASDAVQETVIALWEQHASIKGSEALEKLSLTIVKRRCIDLLRKRQPLQPIDEASLMMTEPPKDDLE